MHPYLRRAVIAACIAVPLGLIGFIVYLSSGR